MDGTNVCGVSVLQRHTKVIHLPSISRFGCRWMNKWSWSSFPLEPVSAVRPPKLSILPPSGLATATPQTQPTSHRTKNLRRSFSLYPEPHLTLALPHHGISVSLQTHPATRLYLCPLTFADSFQISSCTETDLRCRASHVQTPREGTYKIAIRTHHSPIAALLTAFLQNGPLFPQAVFR
jgi:hypothetical protein